MDPAIHAIELTKDFGKTRALAQINLEIKQGIIFGLLGPNGAGKSTFIKILTTLLKPTSGTALVGGYDLRTDALQIRKLIGYVPQLLSADGGLTAYENLELSAKLYGLSGHEQKRRIAEMLKMLNLEQVAKQLVRTYSGGTIRRLEIAQSLLHRPLVLFLDEPTSGLDPVARQTFWRHLLAIHQELNTTVILSTHDMEEADLLCTELAILLQGRIVISGKTSELKANIGDKVRLEDVFSHYTGGSIEGGTYLNVKQARQIAKRLG